MVIEIRDFIIHFRLHYQFFILSAGYLFAALFVQVLDLRAYLIQYLNMTVLLFGTATAFNSYHDRDEGPIGGLKNPPPMKEWMRTVALMLQSAGFGMALTQGIFFAGIYLTSMILFWLYSTPLARWKGDPIKSLIAIGVSTGSNSFWMGYIAAGGVELTLEIVITGVATALIFLSLYPVSQIYQLKEDVQRGDQTFAIRYGLRGVKMLFLSFYFFGILITGLSLLGHHPRLGATFMVAGTLIGILAWISIRRLTGDQSEYGVVMKIKYFSSFGFTLFTLIAIVLVHAYGF